MKEFFTTYTDNEGNVFDDPDYLMVGCSAHYIVLPEPEDMIPLPVGSKLFTLPDYSPVGWNNELNEPVLLDSGDIELYAASAFLPPGYTRLLLPGANYRAAESRLPLWGYTALAWADDQFFIPAVKVDDNSKWIPDKYDDRGLEELILEKKSRLKNNRLVDQLSICASEYHCFAAKNFFMERWECPMPTSPVCNSDCIGCISYQRSGDITASHERIKFVPDPEEIYTLAADHILNADEPVISFGQGCEGEPLVQADTIEKALKKLKADYPDATYNINTNGSDPLAVKRLCRAGLDSIRISLNSTIQEKYTKYHRPQDHNFIDVLKSIKIAHDEGVFVTINLLIFPGISDQEEEIENLIGLVRENGINLIQMKNLCIDPHIYLETVGYPEKKGVGIRRMMEILKTEIPEIRFGYFNRPKSEF
ncbi:MAG: radical SAM protein [bacterium]|nr:radical SAM protein [bacterium]